MDNLNKPFNDFFGGEKVEGDNTPVKPTDRRVTGKIIKTSDEGWGFISSREIRFTRIFFHWTSLRQDTLRFQDLKNGMRVEFTPVEVEGKGFRAIKILVLKDEPKPSTVTETETPVTETEVPVVEGEVEPERTT